MFLAWIFSLSFAIVIWKSAGFWLKFSLSKVWDIELYNLAESRFFFVDCSDIGEIYRGRSSRVSAC